MGISLTQLHIRQTIWQHAQNLPRWHKLKWGTDVPLAGTQTRMLCTQRSHCAYAA
eukprot:CAMPEP_0179151176 /NCGR_PEP_ID=MMETSP0796-20121207/73374_1 /TAXON_ID=73915 /ORGANISM="Pyrodinium bahamense, Strain pbaha01" /LENGTH=54 /DNA_ID=CAMNT_0020852237 /DNA_START=13 /DNA_END=173 /DNA_ORIENTATION=+